MNRIATTPRGFPFDERSLVEIQEQTVPVLNAIAKLIPDRSIIYGVQRPLYSLPGATVSPGFILWNGEFLPFKEAPYHSHFSIMEEVVTRTFNVGTDQDPQLEDYPAYIKRYAIPGNVAGAESVHPFSSLKQPPRFLTHLAQGEVYVGTVVPAGAGEGQEVGTVIDVSLPDLDTDSYNILVSFYRANTNSQGSFDYDVFARTSSGFKLRLRNVTDTVTKLFLSYLILPKEAISGL